MCYILVSIQLYSVILKFIFVCIVWKGFWKLKCWLHWVLEFCFSPSWKRHLFLQPFPYTTRRTGVFDFFFSCRVTVLCTYLSIYSKRPPGWLALKPKLASFTLKFLTTNVVYKHPWHMEPDDLSAFISVIPHLQLQLFFRLLLLAGIDLAKHLLYSWNVLPLGIYMV